MSIKDDQDDAARAYLVAFRIAHTTSQDGLLHVLFLSNAVDTIATINGRIVFFDDRRLARRSWPFPETRASTPNPSLWSPTCYATLTKLFKRYSTVNLTRSRVSWTLLIS